MKKIIPGIALLTAIQFCSCADKGGESSDTLPMDTMNIKTVPAPTDPMDTVTQGHYRYETTNMPGTDPDSGGQ